MRKNYRLKFFLLFHIIALNFIEFVSLAQNGEGKITISITSEYKGKALPFANVNILKDDADFQKTKTDKNGELLIVVPRNSIYTLEFELKGYLPMYFIFDANVPVSDNDRDLTAGPYAVFYKSKELPAESNFSNHPFQKFKYDNKTKRIQDDPTYAKKFLNEVIPGTSKKDVKPKVDQAALDLAAKQAKENEERLKKDRTLTARITFSTANSNDMAAANDKVEIYGKETGELIPDKNKLLATTNSSKTGKIVLDKIKADKKYFIKIYFHTSPQNAEAKFSNRNGKLISKKIISTENNLSVATFVLNVNDSILSFLETGKNNGVYAGTLLVSETHERLINTKILLLDENKKIIQTTRSNSLGAFVFNNVNAEKNHTISITEADPKITANKTIDLISIDGKKIMSAKANAKGSFDFNILPSDNATIELLEVEEPSLKTNITGKLLQDLEAKKPLANTKVMLTNSTGATISQSITDETGLFTLSSADPNQNYTIKLDENDASLKNKTKIFLTDRDGKLIKGIEKNAWGKFSYQLLVADQAQLSEIYVEDPWLKIIESPSSSANKVISEKILFPANDENLSSDAKVILDKIISILKVKESLKLEVSSHTDANGSDAFNLELSNKRAKNAVAYMVNKGIGATRLKPLGYGETKLLNKCSNGVVCSETEHAQNRRIEFKILP